MYLGAISLYLIEKIVLNIELFLLLELLSLTDLNFHLNITGKKSCLEHPFYFMNDKGNLKYLLIRSCNQNFVL